jgi:hypothetical protein
MLVVVVQTIRPAGTGRVEVKRRKRKPGAGEATTDGDTRRTNARSGQGAITHLCLYLSQATRLAASRASH